MLPCAVSTAWPLEMVPRVRSNVAVASLQGVATRLGDQTCLRTRARNAHSLRPKFRTDAHRATPSRSTPRQPSGLPRFRAPTRLSRTRSRRRRPRRDPARSVQTLPLPSSVGWPRGRQSEIAPEGAISRGHSAESATAMSGRSGRRRPAHTRPRRHPATPGRGDPCGARFFRVVEPEAVRAM
jgi:hypothetical protein